jgi:transposase
MIMLHDLCAHLLPPAAHVQLKTLIIDELRLILVAAMMAPKAPCPDCHHLASRVHSGYQRTLADLPWAMAPMQLRLHVRRFLCTTCPCSRQTFSERLPTVAPLYARTTTRLAQTQAETGLALGGAAGPRHLARHGLPVSRHTLLRRVRRLPTPPSPPPQVVGIDDWAWRKGHRYGTIVVDLERGCPIDVLEDRLAETVATWLKAHPDVKIVARDRADAYASGIRQGAPEAVQVADRFHLVQNLAAALEQVFSAHHQDLAALHEAQSRELVTRDDGSVAIPVPAPLRPPTVQEKAAQRRARRLARYEQVWALHRQGWPVAEIVRQVGVSPGTVYHYLRTPPFPEYKKPSRKPRSVLNPYTAYLVQRWNGGCRDTRRLFEEIHQQGYPGSYATVARYTQRLGLAQGLPPRQRSAPRQGRRRTPLPAVAEPKTKPLTARGAVWLVLRRETKRDEDDTEQLVQLQQQHEELAAAIELTQAFTQLVRQRQGEGLEAWLERAAQSGLRAFQSFARSVWEDYKAVQAGLTLPWSTGPVEGHINRLKMLKRQMFGRANIDLLRQRVLLPT